MFSPTSLALAHSPAHPVLFAPEVPIIHRAAVASLPDYPRAVTDGVDNSVPDSSTPTADDVAAITVTVDIPTLPTIAPAVATGSPVDSDRAPAECRLLGPFAILVQLALGGLALLALVYKRWRERPQRPVRIWFFDVSKQVFGSALVHVANVFMSMLTSGRFHIKPDPVAVQTAAAGVVMLLRGRAADGSGGDGNNGGQYVPNPCSFYLLNLAIDTTLGIPILITLLRITTRLLAHTPLGQPPESIQSGNYGRPPNAWWWLKQSLIYFIGLMGMKLCVLVLFMIFPGISRVGDWALGWTEGNERLQIVFVMMLFPLIMNALQYYIIDSFIMKKEKLEEGGVGGAVDGNAGAVGGRSQVTGSSRARGRQHRHARGAGYEELAAEEEDGGSSGEGEDEADEDPKNDSDVSKSVRPHEYDPAVDGDSRTAREGGSGGGGDRGKGTLSPELFPPE